MWVWLKIEELGQTAGFRLWFYCQGAILVRLFMSLPWMDKILHHFKTMVETMFW